MTFRRLIATATIAAALAHSVAAAPLVSPLQAAVASAAATDAPVAAFYRSRAFAPIWMGEGSADRRAAFLWALDQAHAHGLPTERYDAAAIRAAFAAATDAGRRGTLEVEMTRRFLRYAEEIGSGILDPAKVDPMIRVEVPRPDRLQQITAFAEGDPYAFVKSLWPTSPAYLRLLRERFRLEETARAGGWGPDVPDGRLARGDTGPGVVALRDRLIRMGYLARSPVAEFDAPARGSLARVPDGSRARPRRQGGRVDDPRAQRPARRPDGADRRRAGAATLDEQAAGTAPRPREPRRAARLCRRRRQGHVRDGRGGRLRRTGPTDAGILRHDDAYGHQSDVERAALDHREGIPARPAAGRRAASSALFPQRPHRSAERRFQPLHRVQLSVQPQAGARGRTTPWAGSSSCSPTR